MGSGTYKGNRLNTSSLVGPHFYSRSDPNMKVLALLLAVVPALNALCLVNSCDSYWKGAQAKLKKDGACAVLFDENCCKASKDHLVVKKGEQGKLCGTGSSFNPLSSCKGSGLKDDIEALFIMPGCKLEVWDHGSGLEGGHRSSITIIMIAIMMIMAIIVIIININIKYKDAIDEERKGFNQGDYKNMRDLYDQNKLVFNADRTKPHWVEEINDDFDDMDEDIESFRCTC